MGKEDEDTLKQCRDTFAWKNSSDGVQVLGQAKTFSCFCHRMAS